MKNDVGLGLVLKTFSLFVTCDGRFQNTIA